MYTDILNLLTEFDTKLNRKDGKFVNTLPQVCISHVARTNIVASVERPGNISKNVTWVWKCVSDS